MHAIETRDLSKSYGPVQALDSVSFSVQKGEIFGYLGPNGAGKTTTIRILTGITRPTGGKAFISGHNIQEETWEAKRELGIVPETSNVYDDLSAWDNLLFTGDLYNVPRSACEDKARELLETFDLSARRLDKVHGFSKGMKRRLTLAMGLINSPEILFLDEPTSGLDVQSNLIIRQVITDLHADGVTVFLTTHNIEEANILCDRVAIVNHGRIAAIDAPERLKKTIQSSQSIEVAFDRILPDFNGDLSALPLVNSVQKEGDKFRIYTDDPSRTLPAIVDYAKARDLKILSLVTLGPSLEDVFIRLTGLTPTPARRREETP